jgi:hypothetical protein
VKLFDPSGTVDQLRAMVAEFEQQPDIRSILIFACDANGFTPHNTDTILKETGLTVFGGLFPQIIYGGSNFSRGTLIVGFWQLPQILVIPGLSDPGGDYEAVIDDLYDASRPDKTMFVWVDGLSSRISTLIESLFNIFGLEQNYIGGGAGSLNFEQKPCLFTNNGLLEDCAVLALLDIESGIGVSHGWESVSGPFRVTAADSNVIQALDWEPAFQVYQRVVEDASGTAVTHENFFERAKGYPFGISRLGAEYIVRDPIVVNEDGSLVCVGEVPVESYVDILNGSTQSLVAASSQARRLAEESYTGPNSDSLIIFIDCISRVLYLQEDFDQELGAVYTAGDRMVGALTLGEIANSGRDYLEFYNKTAVVGIFEQ